MGSRPKGKCTLQGASQTASGQPCYVHNVHAVLKFLFQAENSVPPAGQTVFIARAAGLPAARRHLPQSSLHRAIISSSVYFAHFSTALSLTAFKSITASA